MEWRRLLPEKFVPTQREQHAGALPPRSAPPPRPVVPKPVVPEEQPQPERTSFFDEFGRTGETIEEQIGLLKSRFLDLQSLHDDFDTLSQPIIESLKSHAAAQSKLAETEALSEQIRKENHKLRAETVSMRKTCDQLSIERTQAVRSERLKQEAMKSLEENIAALQAEVDDKHSTLNLLECQLKAESFKSGSLDDLNGTLRRELEISQDKIVAMQQEAVELHDASALDRAEIARLNETLERLLPAHTAAKRRLAELDTHVQQVNRNVAGLEARYAAEAAARQESEEGRKQDRLILEEEISFLVTQNEAVSGRHAATEKLLEQTRAAVAAKADELQAADRAVKASSLDLTTVKRKQAKAQEELGRLERQAEATEKMLQEAKARNSMLVKALSGKDDQISQNTSQIESLAQQIEALEAQFEQKRSSLESENNKLIEELESARAESALAQGALTIARASREKLMDQINFLKRSHHRSGGDPAPGNERLPPDQTENLRLREALANQKASNVRALRSPESESR